MTIKQPCLGCGQLTIKTRCPECQAPRDQAKNERRAGRKRDTGQYSGDYRKRAALIRATATHCWLCHQAFKPGDRIEADHINPGDPQSPLAGAHRLCNQRRGNKPA